MNFNEQQIEAINHYKGACAVIAGAGSGKSSVLLHRIKNLVDQHKVKEQDILAISFTNNTAANLKKKLAEMGYGKVNVGTFHSVCGKILYQNDINVNNLIKEWQIEKCFKDIDKKANIKDIKSFIGYQKSYMCSYKDEFVAKDSSYSEIELRKFYKAYETFKSKNNMYDLDDWLSECHNLLKKIDTSYDFILVDEHQDSNLVQNLILKQLCKSGNIFCVFDFRQAIYTFRGGNPEYCMNFKKEWNDASVINLNINYRSNNNIVDKANKFIKQYYGEYEYYTDSISNSTKNGNITIYTYNNREEESTEIIDIIEELLKNNENPEEIAVIYRLNSHSGNVENELRKRKIPYDIANDSSFFKRKEIVAIMSYLRLIQNQHDDEAFENVFNIRNYPLTFFSNDLFSNIKMYSGKNNLSLYEGFISYKYDRSWQKDNVNIFKDNITRLKLQYDKGIGISSLINNINKVFKFDEYLQEKYSDEDDLQDRKTSIETFKTFIKGNSIEKFISYIESVSNKKKNNTNAIKLMTVHACKGLEFKNVFIIGVEDEKFPHAKSPINDEARLFYVGVTRPKENLYLSQIGMDNKFIKEYDVAD